MHFFIYKKLKTGVATVSNLASKNIHKTTVLNLFSYWHNHLEHGVGSVQALQFIYIACFYRVEGNLRVWGKVNMQTPHIQSGSVQ